MRGMPLHLVIFSRHCKHDINSYLVPSLLSRSVTLNSLEQKGYFYRNMYALRVFTSDTSKNSHLNNCGVSFFGSLSTVFHVWNILVVIKIIKTKQVSHWYASLTKNISLPIMPLFSSDKHACNVYQITKCYVTKEKSYIFFPSDERKANTKSIHESSVRSV